MLLLAHKNAKMTWRIINNLLGSNKKKDAGPTQLQHDGKLIEDKEGIAEAFNNFFVTIG